MADRSVDLLLSLSRRAVESDRAGHLEEAYELYNESIQGWTAWLGRENNQKLSATINKIISDYSDRVALIGTKLIAPHLKAQQSTGQARTPAQSRTCAQSGSVGARPRSTARVLSTRPPSTPSLDSLLTSPEHRNVLEPFKAVLMNTFLNCSQSVTLDDIAGLEQAKEALKEAVIYPKKFAKLIGSHVRPWQAILLYGPPGTGKTQLARAMANAVGATFLSVSSADLLSKWQGESEKYVRALFELAREREPAIVFIDEIDSLCCRRGDGDSESTRRVKTEFLVQMGNETSPAVLVLGATNVPWDLDSAMLRRFQRRIFIDLPGRQARRQVIQLHLRGAPHSITDDEIDQLADLTEGYSPHDIAMVVQDALLQPLRKLQQTEHFRAVEVDGKQLLQPLSSEEVDEIPINERLFKALPLDIEDIPTDSIYLPPISLRDFEQVAHRTKRTVHEEHLEKFAVWTSQYGLRGD